MRSHVVYFFVGHAINEIDKIWQTDRGALLDIRAKSCAFDPGGPPVTPK